MSILYFLISILYYNYSKDFLKNFLIIKLIVLSFPIVFNSNLILGKVIGYNTGEAWRQYKIENNIIKDVKKDNTYLFLFDKDKLFIKKLSEKKTVKLFK